MKTLHLCSICDAKQIWPPKVFGQHLKLYLEQGDRILEGVAFGQANLPSLLRRKDLMLRVAYTPQINTFHNKTSIQLQVRDFLILNDLPELWMKGCKASCKIAKRTNNF